MTGWLVTSLSESERQLWNFALTESWKAETDELVLVQQLLAEPKGGIIIVTDAYQLRTSAANFLQNRILTENCIPHVLRMYPKIALVYTTIIGKQH